jgi:hypothetical protein
VKRDDARFAQHRHHATETLVMRLVGRWQMASGDDAVEEAAERHRVAGSEDLDGVAGQFEGLPAEAEPFGGRLQLEVELT